MKYFYIFIIAFLLSSCSTLTDWAYNEASNISITYDKEEAKESNPIDSIRIVRSFYWLDKLESMQDNKDYDLQDGLFHVWFVENNNIRRNEVKIDTTIYIYRK